MASPWGLKDEFGPCWSENTSPSSEDFDEIVRSTHYASTQSFDTLDIYGRLPDPSSPIEEMASRRIHTLSLAPVSYICVDEPVSGNSLATSSSALTPWRCSPEGDDTSRNSLEVGDGEPMVTPKMEPMDWLNHLDEIPEASQVTVQTKRPRGRPRKHPKPNPDTVAKVTKSRSKTGCITCRKRKKKCDETKPECNNCQKNSYKCLGYPGKSEYLTGAEKAEREIPRIHLPAMIRGVETPGDRIFLEHYVDRLSGVLTFETNKQNAFKDMLLPLAVEDIGLMHSILALSSKHIDWSSPYGQALLVRHPKVRRKDLSDRSEYHSSQATIHLHQNIGQQIKGRASHMTLSASIGQMLCLVLESVAEGKTGGEHRSHLVGYQQLVRNSPPQNGPFMDFVTEFFQYHILADQLTSLPSVSIKTPEPFGPKTPPPGPCSPKSPSHLSGSLNDLAIEPVLHDASASDANFAPGINHAIRMLGVSDGLFQYMSQITELRNEIRHRRAADQTPLIDAPLYYRGALIDASIRDWCAAWSPSDERYIPGLLYRQMLWVYLWRTLYPPPKRCPEDWAPDQRIVEAVDGSLDLLEKVDRRSRGQTLLLAPVFVIGCASFEPAQRDRVRTALGVVREYTELRNAERVGEVLEEVWRVMDARADESWDWQGIMARMGVDFLAT